MQIATCSSHFISELSKHLCQFIILMELCCHSWRVNWADQSGIRSDSLFHKLSRIISNWQEINTKWTFMESQPVTPGSTLCSSNFPCHVLRLWLQPIRAFNSIVFTPLVFRGWVSSWIWAVWNCILGPASWISNHPSLLLFKSSGCCSHPTVVVPQHWTNNFPRPCRNSCRVVHS